MTELGIYYCYARYKDKPDIDIECFKGAPIKASVDAQHWADEQIKTGKYICIDVKDAISGKLIYSR